MNFLPLSGVLLCCGLATISVAPARAQTMNLPQSADPIELRPAQKWKAFELIGTDVETEIVSGEDARFESVLRASNTRLPSNDYDMQMLAPIERTVEKGDVLLAQFWLRTRQTTTDTGQGTVGFVFERAGAPYTKSVIYGANAGDKWQQFQVPFVATESYAAGEANMIFRLGNGPQTVELANFTLSNYAATVQLADLPRTRFSYVGQELDAPWREQAATAIDRLRKADLIVRVVDAQGAPVPAANVRVHMTDIDYKFGSVISERLLLNEQTSDGDKAKYAQVFRDNFNYSVIENGLKWPNWKNAERRPETLYTAGWLSGNGIPLRGHVLVWPSWENVPTALQAMQGDPEKLRQTVRDHIKEEAGQMRGAVTEWDVINETFSHHELMDVLGRDVMVDWFRMAREADPDARLYINDYGILTGGTRNSEHQKDYEQTIEFLLKNGAPVGGIGIQGHMDESFVPPTDLWKVLDRFGKFGLPITVTEFDVESRDEIAQADYMRDFLTAMFAHPATDGVMIWGFWEGRHWKPDAALWSRDWTLKPVGAAWQKLVKDEWTTRAAGASDAQGEYRVRGFKGKYRVSAQIGEQRVETDAKLAQDGDIVTLILP